VKSRVVFGVLAMIVALALSATAAHAGGRGVPVPLTSYFVCHAMNGANIGADVDVRSDNIGAADAVRQAVRLGQSVLACAQAALFPKGADPLTTPEISPFIVIPTDPPTDPPTVKHLFELKCYAATTAKKSGEVGSFDTDDPLYRRFVAEEKELDVPVSRDVKFVCAPAEMSIPQ
jgi:hypothetical protein